MRIVHQKEIYSREAVGTSIAQLGADIPKSETKIERTVYTNVFEVTFYNYITWGKVYWVHHKTGPRALCFARFDSSPPTVIIFDNENEMKRFQEDLRLQETNARTSPAA